MTTTEPGSQPLDRPQSPPRGLPDPQPGGQWTTSRLSRLGGDYFGRCLDLDAEMIEVVEVSVVWSFRVLATDLEQHQFEWRIGDRKIGIARFGLDRRGAEHLAVKVDRFVQIVDIESKL